ncbi:SIR2 family protein [bacterium]|nr:MAG: SIR2 family protein [bacterium]
MKMFKASSEKDWCSLEMQPDDTDEVKNQVMTSQNRLKEFLLASLQMQHVVVLSGCGTSLGNVGGPSMRDLWAAAVYRGDVFEFEPDNSAKETAKKIGFDITNENIEEFLSRIEVYLQINNDNEISDFLKSCKAIILEKCSSFLKVENLEAHRSFLHRLSRRRTRDSRLKIFTTNYDLCFEKAASELGSVALNGFSFTTPRRYDSRFFEYDIVRRSGKNGEASSYLEGVFLLYKLHGSVNWERMSGGAIIEKENPDPENACIIYPAQGKYQQSYIQPYLEAISQYLAALREPNTCVVVTGLGFNDNHISEPLLAAVQSNPHLRLIVADPCAQKNDTNEENVEVNNYWKTLFELGEKGADICFLNASFEQFAHLIPDLTALTPSGQLMKAVQGVAKEG